MSVRPNYAEGQFYSSDPKEIAGLIESRLRQESSRLDLSLAQKNIIGGVVPHAGHIYCASEAVHFFEIVRQSKQQFDVVIVVNPNHHGAGLPISIDEYDYWSSPFGKIKIDRQLADATGIPVDKLSQRNEHSAEVIVPYIQYFLGKEIPLLPVSFGAQSCSNAKVVAQILFKACESLGRKPLYIASSDFNHFSSPDLGYELDSYALEALMVNNLSEFEHRIRNRNISICGYAPVISLFDFAKDKYGDFKAVVLRRGHSGEVAPSSQVVDYVSLLLYTE